jgi:CHASE3 domain sensor protein
MSFKTRPDHSLWPLVIGFGLLLFAVVAATVISVVEQRLSLSVRTALEKENSLKILGLATDAETGQRGFLLTGKEGYLEPYLAAKKHLLTEIDVFAAQLQDQGGDDVRISKLRQASADKLAELESTVVASKRW